MIGRLVRLLPGVVVIACLATVLVATGVPLEICGLYAAGTVWTVLLPGVLLSRAIRSRARTLVADLSLGFVTGLFGQLVAWFALVGSGHGEYIVWWPVPIVVLTLIIGPLRRRCWTFRAFERSLHPVTAWGGAITFGLASVSLVAGFGWTGLPATGWYPDMYWHLGITHELMRTISPMAPQVAGQQFFYHWFANAHFASTVLATGVDPILVVGRLWMPTTCLAMFGTLLAAADTLVRRSWPGVVAAALVFSNVQIALSQWFTLAGFESMVFLSPSHQFSLPIVVFTIEAMTPALRGQRMGGRWVTAAMGIALLGGAKSSALPTMLCAVALVVVVTLVSRRWAAVWRSAIVLALTIAGLACVSVPLAATGSAGSTMQVFSTVGITHPWASEFGLPSIENFHDTVLPGLNDPVKVGFLVWILALYAAAFVWVGPAWKRLARGDGAAWLLVGLGFAGFAGMMAINHDGSSQLYFLRGSMVAVCLLGAVGMCDAAGARPLMKRGRRWGAVAIGAGWGSAVIFSAQVAGGPVPLPGMVVQSIQWSITVFGVEVALTVMILAVARYLNQSWAGPVLAGFAFGMILPASLRGVDAVPLLSIESGLVMSIILVVVGLVVAIVGRPKHIVLPLRILWRLVAVALSAALILAPVQEYDESFDRILDSRTALSRGELDAVSWIAANIPENALLATNVHCRPVPTWEGCDARAFWVSGLGGRRVLIEGWAYTVPAREAHGVNGVSSRSQPFFDEELFELNEAAFREPTRKGLQELRDRGVTYLVADGRAITVDWEGLDELAKPVYGDPETGVVIYKL